MDNANPLLKETFLPQFNEIKAEHVEPAIDTLLAQNREQIEKLLDTVESPGWKNFVEPLEELDDLLNRAWSPISHMNSVVNT
ncbi:hypothetical protein BOV91_06575, partial [Solemya velum gill symbiont]